MIFVLVVSHDANLYGADKSLIGALRAMKDDDISPIVALPRMGPLVDLLRGENIEVHIGAVGRLKRAQLGIGSLPKVVREVRDSLRFFDSIVANRKLGMVYINTVATVGGAVWARLRGIPVLWHVREIVVTPKFAIRGLPWMVRLLGGWCVCNSHATRRWLTDKCAALELRSSVIWNGLDELAPVQADEARHLRTSLGVGCDEVVVSLVGRINRWKGQRVLIDAAAILGKRGITGVRYLIVGDVADAQDHFRLSMLEAIREAGLDDVVKWQPFTEDVDVVWAASDIAVVPSVEPEPFGRVAIEAMAHALPVVASAHGGLVEIVEAGKTGLLVEPGNAAALADAIATLVLAPELRKTYGEAGRLRQKSHFSQHQHDRRLIKLLRGLAKRGNVGHAAIDASISRDAGGLISVAGTRQTPPGAGKTVRILGTHGVPAAYGGFETAVENIALFLVKQGWRVIVYCQISGSGAVVEDRWNGIERVRIPVDLPGWKGSSKFDWISIRHASAFPDLCLTFGYNTAVFNVIQRLKGIPNVINMDGIEWSRARWGPVKQAILYVNERIACHVGNHLIADHPEIEKYLLTRAPQRKITTLTYGADPVPDAPTAPVISLGLVPGGYMSLIARPIPENSILELVQGFSARPRGIKLAILGKFEPDVDHYHRQVVDAASGEVVFLGAIYDKAVVQALRFHSLAYVHGHTVGGTNPSLVEAMAAGNAVVAHDNPYNRWVVQDAAIYFRDAASVAECVESLLTSPAQLATMRINSLRRFAEEFTWEHVAGQYEQLLLRHLPKPGRGVPRQAPRSVPLIAASDGAPSVSMPELVYHIDGQSVTAAGVFVHGWAFSPTDTIERIELCGRSGAPLHAETPGKLRMRRDDAGALHGGSARAAESGFCVFSDQAVVNADHPLALAFRFASGAVCQVPLEASHMFRQPAGGAASGSRRWLFTHVSGSAWRMLKERKFRAIATAVASKLRHLPKHEANAIGKVAQVLSRAGMHGCVIIVDHDLGGGANAYRERVIHQQLAKGNAVAFVTYHLFSVQWSIELATPGFRERWTLEDLDSIAHLSNRGLVLELRYNTAVSFPNPVHVPVLLTLMRAIGGVRLSAVVHDFFPICPSHNLLDASGNFCNIPDMAACRNCLKNHTDSYVALHRSRDIDEWRLAWGAFLTAADQIVCFSESSRGYLMKAYPALSAAKVAVHPHVVDYLPKRRPEIRLDGPLRIGIVGKIGYSKGAEVVRNLAAEIRRRAIDASIVVIGTLEVAIPGRIVHETGRYQPNEFVDLVGRSGANVFLFPSIWPETFSYVAEELMQLHVPLMCFNLGAPAERVGRYDRGRVIDFKGIPELLDALIAFHRQIEQGNATTPRLNHGLGTVKEEIKW